MIGRRKTGLHLGMARLYEYKGKRLTSYYTITPANERIHLGYDLRDAKRKLMEMDGEVPPSEHLEYHLREFLKERAAKVARGKLSVRTYSDNEAEAENLILAFGKMMPEDLKPKHIWHYLHKARGAKAPIRANREVALLSTLYNRLMGAGVVDSNPCIGVERNEEEPRERLVEEGEFYRFLDWLQGKHEGHQRLANAAEISYLTSKAQAQILRLPRTRMTADGIEFAKRKRGRATLVEWTPRLTAAVNRSLAMPSAITSVYVVFNSRGQPYTSSGFKSMWQRAMNEWEKAGNQRFTFHDIRAKAVSDLLDDGRDASDVTGHADRRVIDKVYDRRRVRRGKAVR
jgi:hypothetical protein